MLGVYLLFDSKGCIYVSTRPYVLLLYVSVNLQALFLQFFYFNFRDECASFRDDDTYIACRCSFK